MINISDIPENKKIDEYPDETEFVMQDRFPRYQLDPFEIILPNDPRYASALSREELETMKNND
ncbi:MAG: hypothetical protein E7511_05805 [Ruminococcus sp.]|nr:hypothetical protein [Ruminococcus sp.]